MDGAAVRLGLADALGGFILQYHARALSERISVPILLDSHWMLGVHGRALELDVPQGIRQASSLSHQSPEAHRGYGPLPSSADSAFRRRIGSSGRYARRSAAIWRDPPMNDEVRNERSALAYAIAVLGAFLIVALLVWPMYKFTKP